MAGPAPAVAAARRAVRATLADLPAGSLVLVACSGGADSVALAAATAFVAPRAGVRAGAVVVDHGLRAGSDVVAEQAATTCRGLGLDPVLVRRVDARGEGGPEAAARTARYGALEAAAQEADAVVVLLGHTLDDQAETVLLGLGRGSGGRSLAGMAERSGRWRRPLLGLRRRETEAVCAAAGLPWTQDPTNAPDGPWRRADGGPLRRSAVRHHVLPALADALGPGVPEALARTAGRLQDDEDYLDAAARELAAAAGLPAPTPPRPPASPPASAEGRPPAAPASAEGRPPAAPASRPPAIAESTDLDPVADPASAEAGKNCTVGANGGGDVGANGGGNGGGDEEGVGVGAVSLDVGVLERAHPALRGRVLHLAATAAGCPPGALAHVHVAALAALVTDYRGQGPLTLPGGVLAWRRYGRLNLGGRAERGE